MNSVTKHFADRGWTGINIEPATAAYARLVADRPADVNLNCGLSDREGVLTFYEDPRIMNWSTDADLLLNLFAGLGCERSMLVAHEVPVTTLRSVCERHVGDRVIDFLKIDVEGHEAAVIAGGDWSRWRPRVVLAEEGCGGRQSADHWEATLLGAGYEHAAFDGLNHYYVRDEDRHLAPRFHPLPNYTDQYVPYEYRRQIDDLRARLDQIVPALIGSQRQADDLRARLDELGPTALDLARRAKRLAIRYPRLSGLVRRAFRRAG